MSINIVVFIKSKPECLQEIGLMLVKLKTLTLLETGCDVFDLYTFENKYVLIERWADQISIDTHMSEEYTKTFITKTKDHLEGTEVFKLEEFQ